MKSIQISEIIITKTLWQ